MMRRKKNDDQPRLFGDPTPEPKWKVRDDFPTQHDGAARHTDPETSKKAAQKVNTGTLKAKAVLCLYRHGICTSHRIAEITGESLVSISPRMRPLTQDGYIEETGKEQDGRELWKLTDAGRELALWLIRNDKT